MSTDEVTRMVKWTILTFLTSLLVGVLVLQMWWGR